MTSIATPAAVDRLSRMYDEGFYSAQVSGSLHSARTILPLIFTTVRPLSVVDIGCGQGAWLAAAEELGSTTLRGVDGPWVDPARLMSRRIVFSHVNLEQDIEIQDRFDLCICMEVAEHLFPQRSTAFVHALCALSDVVLFSAAIRLQGGTNHVNEQWQSYWADLFAARGFDCCDVIRPRIWDDRSIPSWYRQNALLYVARSHPARDTWTGSAALRGPLDIVHPEIYEGNLGGLQRAVNEPTLGFCLQSLGKWSQRQLRKIIGTEAARRRRA
jgi:SAM-dependent methyltransferase